MIPSTCELSKGSMKCKRTGTLVGFSSAIVSRRATSDVVATLMVDSPMESYPLASSLLSIFSRRCWLGRSELGLSQLTRVMVAVGEKMGAEVERENSVDVCGPACRGGVGKGAKKRVSLPDF